jgi:hypothetical protein
MNEGHPFIDEGRMGGGTWGMEINKPIEYRAPSATIYLRVRYSELNHIFVVINM